MDLILGQLCNGCGSTTDLYGSSCKHLTLCFSCGKSMAEKAHKCCHCDAPITRLIKEYNARYPDGIPEFKKNQKWVSEKGPRQNPFSSDPEIRKMSLFLGEESSPSYYIGTPLGAPEYFHLLVHEGNELVFTPIECWYNFYKTAPRKKQSSKYAVEKTKNNKAHIPSVKVESSDDWTEECKAPKEEPVDSCTWTPTPFLKFPNCKRNRCAAESNTSCPAPLKKVKIEYTEDYVPPVLVPKKEAPEEKPADSSRTWIPSSFKFAKELMNMKIEKEVKSDTASSMQSSIPFKAAEPPPPALPESGSELPTGPVHEDEIRAVLLQGTAVTARDIVYKFKSRLMSKENKDALASTLKRITTIQEINGVKFIVLRKKLGFHLHR